MRIIEEYNKKTADIEYNYQKTNMVRTKTIFSWYPIWLNKFSWFQTIEVEERLHLVTAKHFNEYTFVYYNVGPKEEWIIEKIN